MIGAFKILGMNNHEILFDWDGQPVKKTLQELAEKKSTIPVEAAPENPAPARRRANTAIAAPKGPGSDLGNETRACVPGDTNASGNRSRRYAQGSYKKSFRRCVPLGNG